MAIYYIDPVGGNDAWDGLSPQQPKKDYTVLEVHPGDSVLFRRGTFLRCGLQTVEGTENAVVTYGAYGEGEAPVFCGSTDASRPENWVEAEPNIWRCLVDIPGEVGNFVFNEGDCTATFHWEKEELKAQGDFWDSRMLGENEYRLRTEEVPQEVLLYSESNPALYYSHVEVVSFNERILARLRSNMVFDGLRFINSGVHACAGSGKNVTIRNCRIENIGGCAWNRTLRIRFGNGIEFWHYGEDILIENCVFKNIYDSCVTHQGAGSRTIPTNNFICRNNVFDTYGMAAFEYRDKLPIRSSFTDNTCLRAGCGFAMLGETLPRTSEIWPQPMGHHIFLWRIPEATEGGDLVITHNTFGPAPVGAAIYSIIDPAAEAQITLDYNTYTENSVLLNRFGGKNFTALADYQKETGKDAHSTYAE
ncbi:MAG: right-handed parallel beta-helix repeat-containing protein [Clostridia bacterium]|nr:right-handed parallel beta-helix repeat-containing protein [Clostridia bacterium]